MKSKNSALVGGLFGRNALATDDKIPEHYQAFSVALRAIQDNYIDKVDSENLVYGAVRGNISAAIPFHGVLLVKIGTPRKDD